MGIDVQLRQSQGDVLAEVGDPRMVLSRAAHRAFSGTRLLQYVVPWGDATFNQAQARDLEQDIALVKAANPHTPLFDLLTEIEPLVEQLSHDVHAYLWFVGD